MEKPNERPSTVGLLPTVADIEPNYHSNRSVRKKYPLCFYSASTSSIINMLWLYCAAGGRGGVLLTERANAHQHGHIL